ncbi:MAG: hypothetical protein HYW25_03040 [Candidatus Aenigmarchaeota archaeon]|nr:hypothetical protein [Candidatus Aenigmarchaeota archaeon]
MVTPVSSDVVAILESLGFFQFLLPWLFMFAVTYGILSKVDLFGKANKRISIAIALVVAFFTVGFAGPSLANFFISIFGGASLIIAGILVILLFIGMVGKGPSDIAKGGVLVVLIVIGVVLWFLSVGAASGLGFSILFSPALVSLIIVFVVIVLAVWMIVKEDKGEEAQPKKAGG